MPPSPSPMGLSIVQPGSYRRAPARRPACGLQAANSPPPGAAKNCPLRRKTRYFAQLQTITQNKHFAQFFATSALRRPPAQPRSLPPRGSPRCRLRRPAARSPSARGRTVGRGWVAPRAPPPARPQSCRRRAQPCPSRRCPSRSPPARAVSRSGVLPSPPIRGRADLAVAP